MGQLFEKRFVFALITALTTVSLVSSQCCDFYNYACTWDTTTWRSSNGNPPDLTQYPSFVATETDPYFLYIQNQPGATVSAIAFSIPGDGTVISFDYFLDSPIDDPDNYFYVEFYNSAGSFSTWLMTINIENPTWQHAQVICTSENNYCCGSVDKLPCSGTLRIIANVDAAYQQALIAIDSVGTTCYSTPTVPPPSPNCCSFDTETCGSIGSWQWSGIYPAPYVPIVSGNFEWTGVNGAEWFSTIESSVIAGTTMFTFQYYIQSPNAELIVGFKDYHSGITHNVGYLTHIDGTWRTYTTYCPTCCGTGTLCDGQLTVTSNILDGSEVAIDNFGRDNACYDTYSCCLFDDSSICGSVSGSAYGYQWQYSGAGYPYYIVPSPGSNFVYFETVTYTNPYIMTVGLRSEKITINSATAFRGYILIYNPNYATTGNVLNVNFYNADNGYSTQLAASISTTSSTWQTFNFYCNSIYGNCCQGASSCTGYIDFVAVVGAFGGEVVYAVDAFEIDGSCGAFPGSKNDNKQIKFQK